ncbi:MAG: hypothetical protein H0X25_19130 [Acidobacteriales bacterium]|nr:hypothetical protein [Terriglobales bacterium]
MKTDLLAALDGLPNFHLIDQVTPRTFLSGQIKNGKGQPGKSCSSSLLHRIGSDAIIVIPDFSTVLSMNRDDRGAVLADMRRIYDGQLRKEFGTDDQVPEWRGRATFAVATTDEVDRHYSVFQTLGERFVMARWHRPGGVEAALRAMNQDRERGKRDLSDAVHALLLGLPDLEPELGPEMQVRVANLAEFAVRGRTHIPREGNNKTIIYVPEPEAATRLSQQLAQLTKGSALLAGRATPNEEDYALTVRVAFDCIPGTRRRVLDCLTQGADLDRSGLPSSTRTYAVQDLKAVGLMLDDDRTRRLSESAAELLRAANIPVHEMSPLP